MSFSPLLPIIEAPVFLRNLESLRNCLSLCGTLSLSFPMEALQPNTCHSLEEHEPDYVLLLAVLLLHFTFFPLCTCEVAINVFDEKVFVVNEACSLTEQGETMHAQLGPSGLSRHLNEARLKEEEVVVEKLLNGILLIVVLHELAKLPVHEIMLI